MCSKKERNDTNVTLECRKLPGRTAADLMRYLNDKKNGTLMYASASISHLYPHSSPLSCFPSVSISISATGSIFAVALIERRSGPVPATEPIVFSREGIMRRFFPKGLIPLQQKEYNSISHCAVRVSE
jgi:hypothetical protein